MLFIRLFKNTDVSPLLVRAVHLARTVSRSVLLFFVTSHRTRISVSNLGSKAANRHPIARGWRNFRIVGSVAWRSISVARYCASTVVYSFASHVVPAAIAREHARADRLGCVRGWRIWKERVTVHTSVRNRRPVFFLDARTLRTLALGLRFSARRVRLVAITRITSDYRRESMPDKDWRERKLSDRRKTLDSR
ncbi:hypothetical protein WN48_07415 [Eufriesea mexicana]|uniref:Uncharacterized protein n=1 Tax=Eufriesea mexicana TaxID=516756 RepID=A0A310SJ77_9HYME|nr:hypothetical protein WN48_07415 [Eufriesea mexicana]